MCARNTVHNSVVYSAAQREVLIIFPLIFHTIIIDQIMSNFRGIVDRLPLSDCFSESGAPEAKQSEH